ncbi:MAG TPA: ROK family protein [Acidimicrobiales bacterium]|nr:ROK family protein [Acidimicrobiales bacterium]
MTAGTSPRASGGGEVTYGIDVGGTKMLGVALDADDHILAEVRVPTPRRFGRDPRDRAADGALVDALARVVDRLAAELASSSVAGACDVGVGVPGLVDDHGVLRFAPNLPVGTGVDVGAQLAGRLHGARVVVDNDATCAGLAEWTSGAATGLSDVVMVTLGTGIGGGVVAGGRVLRGANGFAAEIGHMVVDPAGPPCPCGKRGCWERYASGSGLARLAREAAHAGRLDVVVDLAGGDPEAVRGEHVTDAAAYGDAGALGVLAELGWWLALGLANLAAVLDPEAFVLGGGLADHLELVLGPTRRAFDDLLVDRRYRPEIAIRPALLGERAGAIGAARLAREESRHHSGRG